MSGPFFRDLRPLAGGGLIWLLLAVSVALTGLAHAWRGLDFSKGVLIGSAVISLNVVWTRSVVRKALYEHRSGGLLTWAYVVKLGLTALVLYAAIFHLRADPIGILAGFTALLLTSVAAMAAGARPPR